MKKKIVSALLVLCMALSLLPFGAFAADFVDLEPGAYYLEAVDWAVKHSPVIAKGTTGTTFSPNKTCTRGEVVTFLWRAFGAEKMFITNPFADVLTTDYFYNSAVWASREGITNGTDETHFSPDQPCTREQVATFLWRALKTPEPKTQLSPFGDVTDASRYSYKAILWALENGVTNGTTRFTFAPENHCTRAQIVTFLYRALAKPLTPAEPKAFTFQPKVSSDWMKEIYGDKLCTAWNNLIDAVLAGKTAFACPDEDTYNWIMNVLRDRYFPLLKDLIDFPAAEELVWGNGVAHFRYTVPADEVPASIAAFADLTEGILNEALQPDDSPFEKTLALYRYFVEHYTYDDAAAEDWNADELSAYRLLTGKTGICTEIARAYSWLLLQAGVEAMTVVTFDTGADSGHEWSYVCLNGKNYHVDPTFGLNRPEKLLYFLMTDEQRAAEGHFSPENYIYGSHYSQEVPGLHFKADDDTFRPLWEDLFDSLDRENQVVNMYLINEFVERIDKPFPYKGW